jgi:hypothetical protein
MMIDAEGVTFCDKNLHRYGKLGSLLHLHANQKKKKKNHHFTPRMLVYQYVNFEVLTMSC